MQLSAMTWPEVGAPVVVVPVGSCEQHGPHLPLDTDTVIAGALAADLASRRDDCVVAPPLTITASGEHAGFAGTLSIGTATTTSVLVELVRSADWAAGVVFVHGHGGNVAAARAAGAIAEREGRRTLDWWPTVPGGDPHAGHTETSLMLALDPGRVRLDRRVTGPVPAVDDLVRHGVRPLSDTGVLGDPTSATAAEGRRILVDLTADLARTVDAWIG